MSELRTNRIVPRDGLPSGSSGGIIQVRSTTLTTQVAVTVASGANTTFYDVSGLSVNITPTRADSKVLVMVQMCIATSQTTQRMGIRLRRGSTTIGASTASGNNECSIASLEAHRVYQSIPVSFHFLDSPATTSQVTYRPQVAQENSGGASTIRINYVATNNDSSYYNGVSTITVMEVSG
jgi:myosin-crossreactive antigen